MTISINDTNSKKYIEEVACINLGRNRRVYALTFGCQGNEADTEKLLGLAHDMGYTYTDEPNEADLIIINTCAIRDHAERRALSLLGGFKAYKKKNPDLIIAFVGCMAAEEKNVRMIKTDFHYVTFTMPPGEFLDFPRLIHKALLEKKREFLPFCENPPIAEGIHSVRSSSHRAWVSIMYGCNNFCSYCIVPYVRGRERSRDSADVIKECRKLVDLGYKEITLLGQNVNSYNSDVDFPTLVEQVANIEGDFIVRFMTSHPKDVSDRLIDVIGRYTPKIAPYFHLPLQSGSDRILRLMNRTYNTERFVSIVDKLRSAVPDITLSTDVIVGFPSETEDDFKKTVDLLKKVRFDNVFSFVYSEREGTAAITLPGSVPSEVRSKRIGELLKIQEEISYEKNLPLLGSIQRVLVDSPTKNGAESVFDGRTLGGKLVHFNSNENSVGKFKMIKIDCVGAFELFGAEISEDK